MDEQSRLHAFTWSTTYLRPFVLPDHKTGICDWLTNVIYCTSDREEESVMPSLKAFTFLLHLYKSSERHFMQRRSSTWVVPELLSSWQPCNSNSVRAVQGCLARIGKKFACVRHTSARRCQMPSHPSGMKWVRIESNISAKRVRYNR